MTTRFARAPAQAKAAPRVRRACEFSRVRPRAEALADAAANDVLGGRTGVARDVGQASAATAHVAGSLGAPLAPSLRARLERGFGADLGAVRVHTDASARQAARAERARGFAAGPDVYVDLPAHALDSELGLRLLAHEVAHVLQQTGRRGRDGRLVATPIRGTGAIQCAGDEALKDAQKDKQFELAPSYGEVKDTYLQNHGIDAELKTVMGVMDTVMESGFQKAHPNAKAIIAVTAPTKTPYTDPTKAFLFDCLKGIEEWEAARIFLDRHGRRLVTSWESLPFYEHYRKKSLPQVGRLATTIPALKGLFPDAFVAGVRAYLLTGGSPDPFPDMQRVVNAINALNATLGPNEVALMAHYGLYKLFMNRRSWLTGIYAKLEKKGMRGQLWHRLSNIAFWFANAEPSDDRLRIETSPEEGSLLAAAWPQVKTMGRQVQTYWEAVGALRRVLDLNLSQGTLGRTPAQVAALAKKARTQPALAGLDTQLRAAISGLLGTPKSVLPTPDAYDAAVQAGRKALQALIDSYDPAMIEAAAGTSDAALQIGLVVADLYDLKGILEGYDKARDLKLVAGEQSPDERVASRVAIAKRLQELGGRYDLAAVTKMAQDALGRGSWLALNGDWEETMLDFKEASEIPGGGIDVIMPAGVTFHLQALWMYSLYYEALSDALEILLTTGEGDYSAFSTSNRPLLEQALQQTKDVARPRQFRMRRFEYRYVQATKFEKGKQVPDPDRTFGNQVYDHPRVGALRTAKEKFGDLMVTPRDEPPRRDVGIRVWFLPNTHELVARLKRIPKLDERVKAAWKANPANAGRTLDDSDWFAWLLALGQLAGTLRKNPKTRVQGAAIASDVRGIVTTADKLAQKRFVPLARRATTHDRIVWTDTVIRPLLDEYNRFDLTTNHKVTDAFVEMGRFARIVLPESDRTVQMAALVFDVAASLAGAVGSKEATFGRTGVEPRRDVVGTALPLVEGSLAVYEDARPLLEEIRGNVTPAELGAKAVTLRVLRDELRVPVHEEQDENTLVGDPNNNRLHTKRWSGYPAKGGFEIYGVDYKIVQVSRPFHYQPTYRFLDPMGMRWPQPLTGRSRLYVQDDNGIWVESPRTSDVPLLRMVVTGGTTEEWDITERIDDKSEARLDRIADQLGDWGAFEHLRNVQAFVEFVATIGIEALELVPGIGQGITAGKFLLVILDLVATGKVEQAIELFGANGIKKIREHLQDLASKFDLAHVLRWLLFQEAEAIHKKVTPKKTTPTDKQNELLNRGGAWTRLARALKNVLDVGLRFVEALIRMKKRVAAPFRHAQLFVLSHPYAAMAIEFIETNWDRMAALDLGELIDPAQEKAEPDFRERMTKGITEGVQEVVDGAFHGIDKVRTLELPHEILPVEVVLDFLIDFAVSQLGLKYKKGLQAVRAALEKIGQWKKIVGSMADFIKKHVGDPNSLWREAVDSLFRPLLEKLRKGFMDVLFDTFLRVPFLKRTLKKRDSLPITELEFAGTDFPESQAYPAPSFFGPDDPELPAQDEGRLAAPGGGDPLAPITRANAELGFGHDFRHVRLHRGSDGARVTRAFRAEAVTTGSHIYLRPSLSPESGFGERVLRHELAHVIQQAGPRPLGGSPAPDPRPVTGEPRQGLSYEPAAESAAHRAASGAAAGDRPLDLGGRVRGVQPFGAEVIRELLGELRKFDTIRAFEKKLDVERGKIAISKFYGDPLSKEAALYLPDKLKALVKGIPEGNLTKPFEQARALIVDAFNMFAADDKDYKRAIWAVIDKARTNETPDKKAKLDKSLYPYLPPEALQVDLEQYIYTKTGVAFHFKMPTTKGGPEVRGKPVLDFTAAPTAWQVYVRYVHLPEIRDKAAAAPLWAEAVKKTFPGRKDQNFFIKVAQLVLLRLGPRPDIWRKDKFAFTSATEDRIVSQAGYIQDILAKPWPTPAQYAETSVGELKDDKGPRGKVTKDSVRSIGLRIGTFKEWGAGSGQTHPDRNAHHITQFLLLKYFSNAQSTYKPFPHLKKTQLDRYPGVDASDAEEVNTIQGDGAKKPIQVHQFAGRIDARGPGMPTILITRLTHMAGIHFRSEEADEDGTGRASQGAATHNVFTSEIGDRLWSVLDSLKDLDALKHEADSKRKTLPSGTTTSKKELREKIFTAAVETYRKMRDDMQPKLLRGLKEQETDYYNAIAELNKGKPLTDSEKLEPKAMDKVHEAAKANLILETGGGFQ